MVQIIRQNKPPSLGEKFSNAVGAGLEGLNKIQQQKSISNLYGEDVAKLPPELQKEFISKKLTGDIESQKLAKKFELQSQLFKDFGINELGSEKNIPSENLEKPDEKLKTSTAKKSDLQKKLIPEEKIIQASLINPAVADKMQKHNDNILKDIRQEKTIDEQKRNQLRQETLPMRTEIANKATAAREGIQNKMHLLDLIKRGNINDPTYAALAEALPLNLGKRMLSDDTVEYKSGLIEEFGDLRNLFKGQTRVKEIELLEQKIADIYLTDSQKEAILNSRIQALKADMIRAEAAAELENEPLSVLQFEKAIEERAKPKLDALFNQILDEQKSIIENAENRKQIPLDPKDPDDLKIMQAIKKEAGGDKEKTKALAKKKGYTW